MPYRVKEPEVTLLLLIGEILHQKEHVAWEHASQTFFKDEVVYEDENDAKQHGQAGPLSPHVIDLYDAGDLHTCNVIEKVVESEEPAPSRRKPGRQAKSVSDNQSE